MLSKKLLTPFEQTQILGGNYVVLTLKFDDKTIIKGIVEKLKDEIIGLNLRMDGNYLVKRKREEILAHKIPPSSQFESIYSMTSFAMTEYLPNFKNEMGTISYNDDTIILNLNHAVCDGKYIAGVASHINDPPKKLDSYFPITFDEEFSSEIKERLQKPPIFYRNDKNLTIFNKFGLTKTPTELLYDEIYDTKSFSNYNPRTKLCQNLTPAIVTGYSLSLMGLQGEKELTHLGGSMACDLRNELRTKKLNHIENIFHPNSPISQKRDQKDPITLNHTNIFTVVPMTAKVSPDMKIIDCYNLLKNHLRIGFDSNKERLFDYRCKMGFTNPQNTDDGIMICFSNLGPVHVKKPVKDLYLSNMCVNAAFSWAIPLLTYAIIDDRIDRNEFHSQVRYEGNGLNKKQIVTLSKSLKHYLQTYNTSNSLQETYNDLLAFQKSLD